MYVIRVQLFVRMIEFNKMESQNICCYKKNSGEVKPSYFIFLILVHAILRSKVFKFFFAIIAVYVCDYYSCNEKRLHCSFYIIRLYLNFVILNEIKL